jgi:hypothetical protein
MLIAARRLAENPKAGFRAVSGLVLALFITTVAVALITTQNAKTAAPLDGPTANILVDQFSDDPHAVTVPTPPAALLDRLHSAGGSRGMLTVHKAGGLTIPVTVLGLPERFGAIPGSLVSCTQLASIPALGHCPAGAAVAIFPAYGPFGIRSLTGITWPAADISASQLDRLPVLAIDVATNGTVPAIERARSVLETAYPGYDSPATLGEQHTDAIQQDLAYQQLADVVVLTSLAIAGCTLAASIAAGLAERKRPFSLLRLAGTPLGLLQRVVALESAVPLLVTAALAVGVGFAAAAMYAVAQVGPFTAPGAAYYVITGAGIAVSLGIIASTMPLLRRITGPEVARNE